MSEEVKTDRVTAIIRIHEWSAWLPDLKDKNCEDLTIQEGSTSLELARGERLMEVQAMNTNIKIEGIDDGDEKSVPHSLYMFQATIAGQVPEGADVNDVVTDQPPEEFAREASKEFINKKKSSAVLQGVPRGRRGP